LNTIAVDVTTLAMTRSVALPDWAAAFVAPATSRSRQVKHPIILQHHFLRIPTPDHPRNGNYRAKLRSFLSCQN
jgi:hypothetical protein